MPDPTRASNKYGVISKSMNKLIATLGDKEPPEGDRLRILGELSAATGLPIEDLQFVSFEQNIEVITTTLPSEGIISQDTVNKLNKIHDFNKDQNTRSLI